MQNYTRSFAVDVAPSFDKSGLATSACPDRETPDGCRVARRCATCGRSIDASKGVRFKRESCPIHLWTSYDIAYDFDEPLRGNRVPGVRWCGRGAVRACRPRVGHRDVRMRALRRGGPRARRRRRSARAYEGAQRNREARSRQRRACVACSSTARIVRR
jgi:hypothetical protein